MKVIFLEDVPGTADAGDVKDVKRGFARNYLLPRSLAAPATADHLQRMRSIQRAAEEKRLKQSNDMRVVANALEGMTLTIEARVGPTGRLYGAVTPRLIAEELSKITERPLETKSIHLAEPIHAPGDHPATVRLYREVTAQVTVSVVPEGYVEEQAAKAAAGEAAPDAAEDGAVAAEEPAIDELIDSAAAPE